MRVVTCVVLAVLLSGCTDTAREDCEGAECPREDPPGPGTYGGIGPIVNATLGSVMFETCRGVGLSLEVPTDTVLDDVPEGFGPSSTVPFFATVGVRAISCARVVALNQTFGDVSLLWSYISVLPDDRSWEDGGTSFYTFEVLVTNGTLRGVLHDAGIPAESASFSLSQVGASGVWQETWGFRGDNATFRLKFPHDTQASGNVLEATFYYWSGSDPFQRFTVNVGDETSRSFHVDAGTIEVEGESGFGRARGAEQGPAVGAAYYSMAWELEIEPTVFKIGVGKT